MRPLFKQIVSKGKFTLGTPAAIDEVLGRITGFEGTQFDDEWPIMVVHTPHGSELRSGRCYVRLDLTEAELKLLGEHEEAVPEKNQPLYGGKLELHRILFFFGHLMERDGSQPKWPRWRVKLADRKCEVYPSNRCNDECPWRAMYGPWMTEEGPTPYEALRALERELRGLHEDLGSLIGSEDEPGGVESSPILDAVSDVLEERLKAESRGWGS